MSNRSQAKRIAITPTLVLTTSVLTAERILCSSYHAMANEQGHTHTNVVRTIENHDVSLWVVLLLLQWRVLLMRIRQQRLCVHAIQPRTLNDCDYPCIRMYKKFM